MEGLLMVMGSKRGWVLGAALLVLAAGPGRADTDPTAKLDPERPAGVVPIAMDNLEGYTTGMLISYLELVQRSSDPNSQANAARVASYLSQTDPNWRVSAANQLANAARTTVSRSRSRLTKPPTPTPTPTPTTTASAAPPAAPTTRPSPATVAPTPTPTSFGADEARQDEIVEAPPPPPPAPTRVARADWSSFAQDQMREFWEADRDTPGAAPKGMIFDPRTGTLVKLDDHQKSVGMNQAFADELANTSSANAGTQKRIKDK